jgi:hypothetical protein
MYAQFKSTERHLKLLSIPFGLKKSTKLNTHGRRYLASSGFSNSAGFKDTTRGSRFVSNYGRNIERGVIKVKKVEVTRPLTTDTLTSSDRYISIFNPNKPDPDNLKEQMTPIEPKTAPRFPKSATTLPSVTKVLQDTMPAASRFLLDKWKDAMIKKLGPDGFNKYQQETFERGRILHSLVADYLLGQGDPNSITKEIVANLWKSIEKVVKDNITNVRLVEHVVTHADMKYRGIVDCVAFYKDELVVIDFKTAEKPKKTLDSLYDNPLQVTAYCGAINNDINIPLTVIDRNICSGLVIVAYIDGSEASLYYLGRDKVVNDYWKKWTNRLDQYSKMGAMKSETGDAS